MAKRRRTFDVIKSMFSSIIWVLKLFWMMSPFYTILTMGAGIGAEIAAVVNTYVFARGIDILLAVSAGERAIGDMYLVVFLFFFMAVFQQGLGIVSNHAERVLSMMFYPKLAEFTYRKLLRLDMATLESPAVNNLVERTRRESGTIERQFNEVISLLGTLTSVITSGVILFGFALHFVPLFVITLIPSFLVDRKYLARLWKYNRDITEERRRAYDSAYFLVDSKSLQELRITGGYKYLRNHFESFVEGWLTKLTKMRSLWFKYMFGFRIVRSLVEAYADLFIFMRFLAGAISIGDVTFYIRQVANFTSSLGSMANRMNNLYEGSLTIKETMGLFGKPDEIDGSESFEKLKEGPEIKLSEVSFSYPRDKRLVLQGINIEIKKGEKVAIVGHNGAGKTTLVKLLLRFYTPSSGSILVNGRELEKLKIKDYYQNVSVLFQDFNVYPNLTVRENIIIGRPGKHSFSDLRRAADYADVVDFIKEYEHGYSQILSEKYKGGTRPSTGQWQKIAIARFFYRNSPLVIFDEPTAAIDAESEAKIFNKIYSFFKNKTVIIISHRFSTVRNADRIIVVSKGRIVEQGSHEELMKLNGTYAKGFKLQAEGYKD